MYDLGESFVNKQCTDFYKFADDGTAKVSGVTLQYSLVKQEFQRNKNLNLCYYYMKYLNYRETLYSMYDHYSSLILFQKEAE